MPLSQSLTSLLQSNIHIHIYCIRLEREGGNADIGDNPRNVYCIGHV